LDRRLSAILAADVVGYARLMGVDEAGTLARLKALRKELVQPEIAERKGRVVKLMGDGLLAEFPSVVQAVACAVAIQQAMAGREADLAEDRRIRLRIGVNLGDIIVEGSDIYGDGVNVAARLEGLAEPGGVCISGTAFDTVEGKLDVAFEDIGPQQVKNIAKPVRAYRLGPDSSQRELSEELDGNLPVPDKPSIAVLPFANLSADPEQAYFADGITEDIITELSKFHTLFVIARNSSFAFKGQSLDARQIGRKLGVRYVVEGSVRRAGKRVRITAQLIDAAEDKHIWAQRYDRDLEDIFAVQDEVTFAIVSTIEPQLAASERKRALRKPPESLDAWENYQRGLWHTFQYNPEDRETTLTLFRRAIDLDPTFASAYAGIGYALYTYIILGASPDRQGDVERAFEASQTAVRLDDQDPFAWVALTRGYLLRADHEAAITAADTAISLNPNFALAQFGRAHALWHSGRPGEAIASHDEAMRLCPLDPMMWAYLASKAIALVMLERFEDAITISQKSQRQANSAIFSHLAEISALGHLGRSEEARDAIARANRKARCVDRLGERGPAGHRRPLPRDLSRRTAQGRPARVRRSLRPLQRRQELAELAGAEAALLAQALQVCLVVQALLVEQGAQHAERRPGEALGAEAVVLEGAPGGGHPFLDDGADRLGVSADLVLGVVVGAQAEEMKQIVQVHLPVPLGVVIRRKHHAGELARQTRAAVVDHLAGKRLVQQRLVEPVGAVAELGDLVAHRALLGFRDLAGAALTVGGGLGRQMLGRRQVELVVEDRIACRVLVHVGGAMADPLAGDEDRQLHVQLDLAHLEGRGVAVAHEIADEAAVGADALGALAVGDPRGLHDRAVVAEVVDDPHEAVVEHRDRPVEDLLQGRHRGPTGLVRLGAQRRDLGRFVRAHAFMPVVRRHARLPHHLAYRPVGRTLAPAAPALPVEPDSIPIRGGSASRKAPAQQPTLTTAGRARPRVAARSRAAG